ncbi:hypothetical protein EYF80_039069 [Liparis tanakae]|uniref:Uncharacterized protein n=1 Tax=Liparis tanakae TaxID=230148 RepID=A0A4Z2GB00_9TELE|nr:hypothetical protein EYF80_039069 [Liparis tanakae]
MEPLAWDADSRHADRGGEELQIISGGAGAVSLKQGRSRMSLVPEPRIPKQTAQQPGAAASRGDGMTAPRGSRESQEDVSVACQVHL